MRIAVIGASREAIELVKKLQELGHELIVLDNRRTRIDEIRSQLDVATFFGELKHIDVYDEARIYRADIVIAAHEDEESNIIACVFSRYRGVPRVIAVVNSEEVAQLLKTLGLAQQVVVRTDILTHALLDALMDIKSLDIDGRRILAIVDTSKHRGLVNMTIHDVRRRGLEVLAIIDEHGKLSIAPKDDIVIKPNWKLVIVGEIRAISEALNVGI